MTPYSLTLPGRPSPTRGVLVVVADCEGLGGLSVLVKGRVGYVPDTEGV